METQLDINNSLYLQSLLMFAGTPVSFSVIKYTTCHVMTIMTSIKKVTDQILRIRETNYCVKNSDTVLNLLPFLELSVQQTFS